MATPELRLGVVYDFRVPPGSEFTQPDLYREVLEQARLVDQLGFDQIWVTEHHFVEDGYLPSFAPVMGALGAITERVRLSTNVGLMPFHHPIRLAEDMAVLDQITNGRIELGLGMGYADFEFDVFGFPKAQRVSRTEEGIQVLQQAWSHSPVNFSGKRYDFSNVEVYPKPVQSGGIPLWLAGTSTPGAQRAARFGLNFLPQGSRAEVLEPWREEVTSRGGDPSTFRVGINRPWMITDDVERDWPPVKEGEVYRSKLYRKWNAESGDNTSAWSADDKIPQTWVVGSAEDVLEELTTFILEYGITDLNSWVAPPGMLPSVRNESLEAFAKEVAPELRERVRRARNG